MTNLRDFLGSRLEVMYECMYTRHLTQKRKIWQDGFLSLYASRRLVLYADDEGKAGKAIEEAKFGLSDWDRKEEGPFTTSKFLVEIVNETPIASISSMDTQNSNLTEESTNSIKCKTLSKQLACRSEACLDSSFDPEETPCSSTTKFRLPHNRDPSKLGSVGQTRQATHLSSRNAFASKLAPPTESAIVRLDFDRNPTSEWKYIPNAVNRSPDEVLALLEK
ncbi:hypothetical protein CCR75_004423 [Bremia lactucae]|uniref:5'-3' DNA helicase ZGRF1-like N-terminal domain-containing protein n=1 Tax=Bremia lactucae TaxID=4779 RepID=A0A976IGG5_BRELC|nr:hypothetical protein CCR75_004423 [Bremia lactucae]